MTISSHLASEHNVWPHLNHSAFYGLGVSDGGLHKLHAALHGAAGHQGDLVVLDDEYTFVGPVEQAHHALRNTGPLLPT